MAEDQRPPGEDVVDVAVAVDVDEVRALAALDEERRAADGSERADGRADAAWQQARRLREEPLGPRAIHTPAPASARTTDSAAVSPDRMQSGMPTPRYAAPATASPGCSARARLDPLQSLRMAENVLRHSQRPALNPDQRGLGSDPEESHLLARERHELLVGVERQVASAEASRRRS